MNRRVLRLLFALVLLSSVGNALAFYNPTTGRWLNRDPMGERGSPNPYVMIANDAVNETDLLGLILFDKSSNWMLVYAGRWWDVRAYGENFTSGDSFRVASSYSYHVLKSPVDLVEGIAHLPALINSVPELADLVASGKLWCILGDKKDEFLQASAEKQMDMLAALTGTAAGGWATGAEGANLLKALKAAQAARAARLAGEALDATKTTGEIVKDIGLAGRIGQSGMTTRQVGEFFGWGSKEITKPLSSFSRESLEAAGWTREKLLDMAQGYRKLAEVTPNKSAPLRADQLENLANLFEK